MTRATSGTRSGPPGCAHVTRSHRTSSPTPRSSKRSSPRPTLPRAGASSRSARGSGCSRAASSMAARRSPRSSWTVASPPSCATASRPSSSEPTETGPDAPGGLRLIEGDALDQDLVRLLEPPYDVVANLPYHITSPILHALLGEAPRPARSVLMVQREVAERICCAAREDELPVGIRAVPRAGSRRVSRAAGGVRARAGGRIRR